MEERTCRGTCGRSLPATSDYFTVERYRKTDGRPIFATLCRDCRRARRSKQYHDNIEVEKERNHRRYNTVEAYDQEARKRKTAQMRAYRERDRIERATVIVGFAVDAYAEEEGREEFLSSLLSGARDKDIVEARSVAIYAIRNHCYGLKWAKIGEAVGLDRTSAMSSYKKILRDVRRRNGKVRNKSLRLSVDWVTKQYLKRFVPNAKRLKPVIKKHRVVVRSTSMCA